jgi:TM2 domain-containing membrane protein YozV
MKRFVLVLVVVSLVIGMIDVGFCEDKINLRLQYMEEKKSPSTALLWSLIIPGGGQIYNGQVGKGLATLGATIVCSALMFEKEVLAIGVIGIGVWSCVDAYMYAKKYNEMLQKRYNITMRLHKNRTLLCMQYNF